MTQRCQLLRTALATLVSAQLMAQTPSPPTASSTPAAAATPAPDVAAAQKTPMPRVRSNPTPRAAQGTPAAASPSAPARARGRARSGSGDRIDLDAAQITGNRELPKVLYIVPWKRPDLGDLLGKPVNSLLDEVLAPVDRDVFRRENRYFDALQPAGRPAAEPAATPGGAVAPPAAKPES